MSVQEKINTCLSLYATTDAFLQEFSSSRANLYLSSDGGREWMITNTKAPTINIARQAYGNTYATAVIGDYIIHLANVMGAKTTSEQVASIAEVVASSYGDLKVSELMLAFRMMEEGKIRTSDGNAAKMYGALSVAVITDCLHQFRYDYRPQVIDRYEQEQRRLERERHDQECMTYTELRDRIAADVFAHPGKLSFYSLLLKPQDMQDLQYFADERKALLRLKQRVEEVLNANPDDPRLELLKKGVEYINKKFPSNTGDDAGTDASNQSTN